MRSMLSDPVTVCHQCLEAYINIYSLTLSFEYIYLQWQEIETGVQGSYRIFKQIVNIYEQLEFVDIKCRHREIVDTVKEKTLTGTGLLETTNWANFPAMIPLLLYGLWWDQPEDAGFGFGGLIKEIYGIKIDELVSPENTAVCPEANYFDSRETYQHWRIGGWDQEPLTDANTAEEVICDSPFDPACGL